MPMRHRLRWIAVAIAAVLLVLVAALVIHVHALLQPQRFTNMLEADLSAAGLSLKLQSPAEPMLFPRPGVKLEGITLSNAGSGTPLLEADAATIVVPWRTLLRGAPAIERVDIDSPRVDLDELKALLARLPRRTGPPSMPTVSAGIHLSDGTLVAHGVPLLFGISIDTGSLAPGQRFRLDASAHGKSGQAFTGSLDTVPSAPHDGAIDFMPINLRFAAAGGASLQLQGRGSWRGGEALNLNLSGQLQHASLLPAPAASSGKPVASAQSAASAQASAVTPAAPVSDAIIVAVTPQHGTTPLTIAIKLAGVDARADLKLQPAAFADWWQRMLATTPVPAPMPTPFTGTATLQRLDLGWLQANGIEIESGPDLAPAASASSTPAPAAASAH
ncbi:MAG TPA: AsmA family protein [Rhodanobacteraceae bacterium]|nr:AsmA family protein [Rhodanobacteraceae bacterium]